MTPEETIKVEILEYVTKGEYLQAYLRLMQILDPDLSKVANLIAEVRKHGHGQVTVNIGKGKINSSTEVFSHVI